DEELGRVGEVAAGQVGSGVRLVPGDGVENVEAELLHGEADREDHVVGAGNPYRSRRLEDALDLFEPPALEGVILRQAARRIPLPLVHRCPPAALTGEAAVGEIDRKSVE